MSNLNLKRIKKNVIFWKLIPGEIVEYIFPLQIFQMTSMVCLQESNAFALYNKALGLQRTGNHQDAERVFHQLLNIGLLLKVR